MMVKFVHAACLWNRNMCMFFYRIFKMRKQSKQELFLDHYLSTLNLWRKPTAKDGFCLFRAVSEQV